MSSSPRPEPPDDRQVRAAFLLAAVGEVLGASLDLDETLGRVAHLMVPGFADSCVVYLREGRERLRVAATAARDEAGNALLDRIRLQALPLDDATPAARVTRTGEPEWLPAITPEWLVAPLARGGARGQTLGCIAFGRQDPEHPFEEADMPLAVEVARRAAVAVENARLYAEAQRARDRQRVLADASELLATSLDLDATLARVARLPVPQLADWCGVYLRGADGGIQQVAVAHARSEKEAVAWELSRLLPIDPEGLAGVPAVIRTGQVEVHRDRSLPWLERGAVPEELLPRVRALGLTAVITVPLRTSGRVLGALTFGMAESGRSPDDDTVTVAQALAERAASAIDRALLFREAHAANRRLGALADISRSFAEAGFDVDSLCRTIVERVASVVGDSCSVHLLESGTDVLRLAAVAHRDPGVTGELQRMLQAHPMRVRQGLTGRVVAKRRTIRVDHVELDTLFESTLPEYSAFAARYPIASFLSTPIAAGEQVVGALGVTRYLRDGRRPPPYSREDELLLMDIAQRAALALLRAREHAALRAERQRLDSVLLQMPSAVSIVEAPSGRLLLRNPQNEAIFRRPLAPGEWPLPRALARGEQVRGEEVRIVRGDGTEGHIRLHAGPVRDERGEIVADVVIFDDVTEQRRMTERIALLARVGEVLTGALDWDRTLAAVVELVLPALGDFGFFDVIEEERPGGEPVVRRLARAPGDPVRQALLDQTRWMHSTRQDMNLCALSTGAPGLHARVDERWLRDVATSPEHLALMQQLGFVSMMTVPLRYEAHVLGSLTLFVTEPGRAYTVSELQFAQEVANRAAAAVQNARLYRDLREALAQAEAASRAKDEFLAMLGHELRNPMAPILTSLELMRRRDPSAHQQERQVMERQARHLVRLIDDLLDVARIARGRVQLDRHPVELAEVVTHAAEIAEPLVHERGHGLRLEVPRGLRVSADAQRLSQVFANLLTNAAKYTEPGGQIEVLAVRQGPQVTVTVSDSGAGIPAELLPSVFDSFVQGRRSLDRPGGGLGLGLSIVRGLVEQHGGVVRAESDGLGRGSRFLVTLPLEPEAISGAPLPSRSPEAPGPRRVLLVDDNRDAAEMLAELLTQLGLVVQIAFSPRAALDLAAPFAPEVALLDIGLPEMDGYELGQRLLSIPGLEHLRLIALTGYGQESDRARSLRHGFAEHLVKPVELDALLQAITTGRSENRTDSHA
jgi:signal transduction histidine kinase/CheY-like chemotaxis protein